MAEKRGEAPAKLDGVEEAWRTFWAPILLRRDGTVKIDQLKRELYDFKVLMRNVSIVYDEVADLSKPLTDPRAVIQEAQRKQQEYADWLCDEGECKCALAREEAAPSETNGGKR